MLALKFERSQTTFRAAAAGDHGRTVARSEEIAKRIEIHSRRIRHSGAHLCPERYAASSHGLQHTPKENDDIKKKRERKEAKGGLL